MRKIIILILFIFLFKAGFVFSQSVPSDISVSPVVIDAKGKIRDILEYTLTLKNNNKDRMISFFPVVFEVFPPDKKEIYDPAKTDKSQSLASWLRITRNQIDLLPGQEKTISLSIEIHLSALPGNYHALVVFAPGTSEPEAKANALKLNLGQTAVNLEVVENAVERLQLKKFQPKSGIFFKKPIEFLLEIENTGEKEMRPKGGIYLYNKRGQEIDFIPLENLSFLPAEKKEEKISWQGKEKIGYFKAKLYLEYGQKQKRDLQDTAFYWFLPWQFLIFLIVGIFLLILILIFILKKHTPQEKILKPIVNLKKKL